MSLLKVQLNHPGKGKPFIIGEGYHLIDGKIIREWNNDLKHYRKFIRSEGEYLLSLNAQPLKGRLLFWGEWEGNSVFRPLGKGDNKPNGIHEPFHSIIIRGCENTDPYVYGDYFKYATCSQSGELTNLDSGSLIFFGTAKDIGFELDTVFVVKGNETAHNVLVNNAANYTKVYFEETIVPLRLDYYNSQKRIYHGQTWWDNTGYFSFVPCKEDSNIGFQKALLPIPPLAKQKVGHPYMQFDKLDNKILWEFVVSEVLKQGFYLGIRLKEPDINNTLFTGSNYNPPKTNINFYTGNTKNRKQKGCK